MPNRLSCASVCNFAEADAKARNASAKQIVADANANVKVQMILDSANVEYCAAFDGTKNICAGIKNIAYLTFGGIGLDSPDSRIFELRKR